MSYGYFAGNPNFEFGEADDLVGGATGGPEVWSSACSAVADDEGNDDDLAKQRKREKVAQASKAAREKRKREVAGLKQENQRLRVERDTFLDKILDLQMKVEALREEGSIDVQLENELLKAQLEEHKKFVGGFMKLASGVPSSEGARRKLYKQGADYAMGHALSLVSQSIKNEWKDAALPPALVALTEQSPDRPAPMINICFQFVDDFGGKKEEGSSPRQRLNLRVDLALPKMTQAKVAQLYWDVWTEEREQNRVYGLKSSDGYEFKRLLLENLEDDDKAEESGQEDSSEEQKSRRRKRSEQPKLEKNSSASGQVVSAAYFREHNPPPQKTKDWVFVATKQVRNVARSTIVRSPASESGGESQNHELYGKSVGACKCTILARSTTQHLKAPHHENTQRITSMLIEGCLLWEDDEIFCVQDTSKPLPGTRVAVVLSMPDDLRMRTLNGFSSILNQDGTVSQQFGNYLLSFIGRLNTP